GHLIASFTTTDVGGETLSVSAPGIHSVQFLGTHDFDGVALDDLTFNRVTPAGPPHCPQGQGFWKNHPDAWSVTSLTLGRQTYTQAQLLTILTTPVRGDASLILADQLIAAKLNIANGSDPTPISATITDADSLLSQFGTNRLPYNVQTSSAIGQQM